MNTASTQPPTSVINNVLNQGGIGTSQANAILYPTHKRIAVGVRKMSGSNKKNTKYTLQN